MIKMETYVVANTSEELESLQSLLLLFPESFNYSVIENDNEEFPFRLLVETTDIPIPSMGEFLTFLSEKIAEVNQAV